MFLVSLLLPPAQPAAAADSIDAILARLWRERGVEPAARCTDEQFLRRVTLDLAGRVPTLDELREFARRPDRAARVGQLLEGDEFARFWSQVWTSQLNGYRDAFQSDREVLRRWLEEALRRRTPYDEIAYRLIAAEGNSAVDGPVNFLLRHPEAPEVRISRIFLGVRLDCARCHDHPFDRWTQDDYQQMSRFFSAVGRQEISEGNIRLVSTEPRDRDDPPRFLTGATARTPRWREEFSLLTTRSKPFARTFANRLWYFLLGRGIVEPVDDFSSQNPPASRELLEHLAGTARDSQFDIRAMCRLICNSRAYQLSSAVAAGEPQEIAGRRQQLFALRTVKPLMIEQQLASLSTALGVRIDRRNRMRVLDSLGVSLDDDFSRSWERRETAQSLMSRLSRAAPPPTESVDELFQRILSRPPSDAERTVCRGRAPEEITFALIHSHEFSFNH